MRIDDILFLAGKLIIAPGVEERKAMMLEPVPAEPLIGVMPVIKIVIMEQSAAHQCPQITADPVAHSESIGHKGHFQTMGKHRNIRMRNIFLHFLIAPGKDDFTADFPKGGVINRLFAHFFSPHFCCISSRYLCRS